MISQVTSLELMHIVDEMQALIDGKVDRIYQPEPKAFDFVMHKTGLGKRIIRISLPGIFYISCNKREYPLTPPGFCLFLRRRLGNSRLRKAVQLSSERVVEMHFETKDKRHILIIELFSKGNIVLCGEDMKIISPLERQSWSAREIKPGVKYAYPRQELVPFSINYEDFSRILKGSGKAAVRLLAVELGLGGTYAEEVCFKAGLDKNLSNPDEVQAKKLFSAFRELISRKPAPLSWKGGDGSREALPFMLESLRAKGSVEKKCRSFNEAIDWILSHGDVKKKADTLSDAGVPREGKYEKIIRLQEEQAESLKKKIEDSHRKGELIYENFSPLSGILDFISEAKKSMGWEELKKELRKKYPKAELDTKSKTVEVEL